MIFDSHFFFDGSARWNLGWQTPNYGGAFIATIIPYVWALSRSYPDKHQDHNLPWRTIGMSAIELCCYIALAKTYSRGALVATVAAGMRFALADGAESKAHEYKIWASIRFILLIGAIICTGFFHRISPNYLRTDFSTTNRIELWKRGVELVSSAPLRGWGLGESGRIYMDWFQRPEMTERYVTLVNSYLTVAAEIGLPAAIGVICFLLLLIGPFGSRRHPGPVTNLNHLLVAAKSSVFAWAVANAFTSLFSVGQLWIVPALSAAICVVLHPRRPMVLIVGEFLVSLAASLTIGLTILAYGTVLSAKNELSFQRAADGAVLVTKKGRPEYSSSRIVWNVWPDKNVLGGFPGHQLRCWFLAAEDNPEFHVYRLPPSSAPDADAVMLIGRNVNRLSWYLTDHARLKDIVIFHPIGQPAEIDASSIKGKAITLILPQIDQLGQVETWKLWARRNNIAVSASGESGIDARSSWDKELENAGMSCRAQARGPTSPNRDQMFRQHESDLRDSPLWRAIVSEMKSITVDGTLRRSYRLYASKVTAALGLRCYLEHRIYVDENGYAKTTWLIPSLRSWLVPLEKGRLSWLSPSGTSLSFDLSQIQTAYDGRNSSYQVVRSAGSQITNIYTPAGLIWSYLNGSLVRIHSPSLGDFDVAARGGLLTNLRRHTALAEEPSLLSAEYDGSGNVVSLKFDGSSHTQFRWSDDGLSECSFTSLDKNVRFTYSRGLLSSICASGEPKLTIGWLENPGYLRGDSRWPEPVHLTSEGDCDYRYEMTRKGFEIRVINKRVADSRQFIVNPTSKTITLLTDRGGYIVQLSIHRTEVRPVRISDMSGRVLEGDD